MRPQEGALLLVHGGRQGPPPVDRPGAADVPGDPGRQAGPVGEALIMTALGLACAVPAVLLYNYLVRRNKVINEKLRSFASDLQTYLVTNKK